MIKFQKFLSPIFFLCVFVNSFNLCILLLTTFLALEIIASFEHYPQLYLYTAYCRHQDLGVVASELKNKLL